MSGLDGDIAANYAKAKADIKGMIALIRDESRIPEEPIYDKVKFECNVTEDDIRRLLKRQKNIFTMVIFFRQFSQDAFPVIMREV